MKTLLILISISFMVAGCVAVPVYDSGYYGPAYYGPAYYAPYPYPYPYYLAPEISVVVPVFRGGHGFHGGRH